jgi:membrane dipeptidase
VTAQEPGVVALNDGRLLMWVRTDAGEQYHAHSFDSGETWSPLEPMGVPSPRSPASIERIPSSGELLMVWNDHSAIPPDERKARTPLSLSISEDGGETWGEPRVIEDDSRGWYCYTAIEFVGDHVLLAYAAGRQKPGQHLSATRLTRIPIAWCRESIGARPPISVTDRARKIHASAPVIDGHNDLPWAIRSSQRAFDAIDLRKPQPEFHTDIGRLHRGGVGAQFWSVYVPARTRQQNVALATTLEQIELVKRIVARYPDVFALALTSDDVVRIRDSGKIASMIGVEGGHSIENSLNVLRQLHRQGARYMTLTHSQTLDWADSCSDEPLSGGLSAFGEQVVREMNRLGMLVDLSHVSVETMRDALRVTKAPVIFSHSSARAIADHPRNVPDEVLRLTAENGGVVMINFFNSYVEPALAERSRKRSEYRDELRSRFPDNPDLVNAELRKWEIAHRVRDTCDAHDVVDHIEHVIEVAGIDHVGLGSDYDGVPAVPAQLGDVSTYPVITQGLLDRGYTEDEIRKVLGGNVLRVFREVEAIARQTTE